MISSRHTSVIYQVQNSIVLFFFLVSMTSLSIPLIYGILAIFPDHLFPLVVCLLLYMAGTVVLGSFIHTLSYIPFHLASAFDPIKNDIASGVLNNEKDLAARLTAFTAGFFNFAFLDIEHAFVHTEDSGIVSHENLENPTTAMEEFGMLEMSKTMEDIIRAGKISEGGKEYHLYILPIWFGPKWLGYMGLMTRRRIGRFTLRFLSEFENNFLDDQFMHVRRGTNHTSPGTKGAN